DVLAPRRQPWRAFHRGWRLLTTNVCPRRRTTVDPGWVFNDFSELRTFICSSSPDPYGERLPSACYSDPRRPARTGHLVGAAGDVGAVGDIEGVVVHELQLAATGLDDRHLHAGVAHRGALASGGPVVQEAAGKIDAEPARVGVDAHRHGDDDGVEVPNG